MQNATFPLQTRTQGESPGGTGVVMPTAKAGAVPGQTPPERTGKSGFSALMQADDTPDGLATGRADDANVQPGRELTGLRYAVQADAGRIGETPQTAVDAPAAKPPLPPGISANSITQDASAALPEEKTAPDQKVEGKPDGTALAQFAMGWQTGAPAMDTQNAPGNVLLAHPASKSEPGMQTGAGGVPVAPDLTVQPIPDGSDGALAATSVPGSNLTGVAENDGAATTQGGDAIAQTPVSPEVLQVTQKTGPRLVEAASAGNRLSGQPVSSLGQTNPESAIPQGVIAATALTGSGQASGAVSPDPSIAPGIAQYPRVPLEATEFNGKNMQKPDSQSGETRLSPTSDPSRKNAGPMLGQVDVAPNNTRLASPAANPLPTAAPDQPAIDHRSRESQPALLAGAAKGVTRPVDAPAPIAAPTEIPASVAGANARSLDGGSKLAPEVARAAVSRDQASAATQAAPVAPPQFIGFGTMPEAPGGLASTRMAADLADGVSPVGELLSGVSSAPHALADAAPNRAEPALARHVGAQLADLARNPVNGPVELTLSPEELGRVRLVFHHENGNLTVQLTTERPETMELMRRHIETLAQELRNIGYREVNFGFGAGQGGQGGQAGFGAGSDAPPAAPHASSHPEAGALMSNPEIRPQSHAGAAAGIDIRL